MTYASALIRNSVVSSYGKFFILSPYNSQQWKSESEEKEEVGKLKLCSSRNLGCTAEVHTPSTLVCQHFWFEPLIALGPLTLWQALFLGVYYTGKIHCL